MIEPTVEKLEQLAAVFFSHARSAQDTSRKKFCAAYKVSSREARRVFPRSKWRELQDQWVLARVTPALEEAYNCAVVRSHFSLPDILRRTQGSGIGHLQFMRIAGDEWRQRRRKLPTEREKVLKAIKDLVSRSGSRSGN